METMALMAHVRPESGKGPARRLRAAGMVPAVFYGSGAEAIPLSVNCRELLKLLKEREESLFVKVKIEDGGKKGEHLSMIKEIQMSPSGRGILHVDFYEIRMDHKLTVDVPIHFIGTPMGVTNGGELLYLKRELKISGLPSALPESVQVDISGLDIGDSMKVADIQLVKGVEALDAGDIAIASIAAPRAVEAVEVPAGEGEGPAEPEVVGKKAEEKEES
jgi:large subunit ribosomal protein L25